MVPIRNALEKLATDLGKTYSDYNILCQDNDIVQVGGQWPSSDQVLTPLTMTNHVICRLCLRA